MTGSDDSRETLPGIREEVIQKFYKILAAKQGVMTLDLQHLLRQDREIVQRHQNQMRGDSVPMASPEDDQIVIADDIRVGNDGPSSWLLAAIAAAVLCGGIGGGLGLASLARPSPDLSTDTDTDTDTRNTVRFVETE